MSLGRENAEKIGKLRDRVSRLEEALRALLTRLDSLDELPSGVVREAKQLLGGSCPTCDRDVDDAADWCSDSSHETGDS